MSLANAITITRGLAIVPVVVLLVLGERWAAWWVFLAACATDPIDGLVARKRHEVTRLGKVLDPLVDKALYVSVLFTLYTLGFLPTLAVVLFLAPQVGIGIGALALRMRGNLVQAARILGKVASASAFVAIAFVMAGWPGGVELFYTATALTYAAAIDYYVAARSLSRSAS
ncbi:MAG: CDP-alcohol phosphatidyltransferase family protein [Candidatus Bipolaricaulota bacterium]|nr:CDP-alcohol phosphatidyltransferase family protein [Candidatus Bipolaricaulota bacterium]